LTNRGVIISDNSQSDSKSSNAEQVQSHSESNHKSSDHHKHSDKQPENNLVSNSQSKQSSKEQKEQSSSKKFRFSRNSDAGNGTSILSTLEGIYTSKYFTLTLAVIFILFTFYIAAHTRDGQADFSGLRPLVEQNIYAQIRSEISAQVDAQYPIGTADFKSKLVDTQFNSVKSSGVITLGGNPIKISDIVDQNLLSVKANFQYPNGQTYLGSIDPYYYYTLANDYYDHGYTGDKLDANGKPVITKMLAPIGVPGSFHPEFNIWIIAETYKVLHIPDNAPDYVRVKAIFFLPMLLSLLAVIPCYLIVRRFSTDLFAFFGTLVCMTTGIFVSRTLSGSIDNDPYYVIFPIIITAFFIYAIVEKRFWLAVVLAAIAGFAQGFMAWTLGNSWFILFFIGVSMIMFFIYLLIECVWHKNYGNILNIVKKEGLLLVVYLVSSAIFHFIYNGTNIFIDMVNGIFGNISGIASFDPHNIWPNVLSSVAELNPSSFAQVVSSIGGSTIFVLGLLGIVFLCLDFEWKRSSSSKWMKWATLAFALVWFISIVYGGAFQSLIANSALLFLIVLFIPVALALVLSVWNSNLDGKIAVAILLSVWMAGTTYMSFNGVRFIMLLGPAFAIAFALSLYYIAKIINTFCEEHLGFTNFITKRLVGAVIALVIFMSVYSPMYTQAMQMSIQPAILFDRAWFDAMDSLRANSSPDAIVTSWWDFGHFYHAIGERAVTFDGASQTTPQAYWVGRVLLENNESVSRDILRMLICGGNTAFDTMLADSHDPTNGILVTKVLSSTLGQPLNVKDDILRDNPYLNFTQAQIADIMPKLACDNPRENIFITSGDMIGKASVWAHWGSWDFTKKYVFDNYKSKSALQIATDLHETPALISQYVNELNQISIKSQTQGIKYNDLINQWFAQYPGYYPTASGGYLTDCTATDTLISCGPGGSALMVGLNNGTMSVNTTLGVSVGRLIFLTSNSTQTYTVGAGNVDAVLAKTNSTSYSLLMAVTPLGGSLFTKLFFFSGAGTHDFEYISGFNSQTAGNIFLWRTNWSDAQSDWNTTSLALTPTSGHSNVTAS